jgi:hypothetical protein
MKKNQLLLLVAVALVVSLAGGFFQLSQSDRWNNAKTDRTIFQNLPVNDVTKIQLRSTPATVTLEKKGDEWRVAEREDYPADFTKIRDLTRMLWELKAGQETQIGPSQLSRLKVLAPGQGTDAGLEIDLQGEKEKQIASLIIGKSVDRTNASTDSPATGRFVYNPAVKDRVYLVSESFVSVDPVSVGSWLDKTFITPGEPEEIDQAAWSNNPGWRITRQDAKADWELENPQADEKLDKAIVQNLSTFSPTFVDVRPLSTSQDETGLKDPFKITVKTFDGFTYILLVGKAGPDKTRYLQLSVSAALTARRTPDPNESAEDKKKKDEDFDKKTAALKERLKKEKGFEKWIYLVPEWNLEQILKRRDEILSKPSPSPAPPTSPGGAVAEPTATPAFPPLPEVSPTATPAPSESSPPSISQSPSPSPTPTPSGATVPEPTTTPASPPLPENSPSASPAPSESSTPEASPSPGANPSSSQTPSATPAS